VGRPKVDISTSFKATEFKNRLVASILVVRIRRRLLLLLLLLFAPSP
jgi:hypothetical protein